MKKVKISYNPDEEMMSITTEDETLFYGNYWDFDRSPKQLAKFLKKIGVDVHLTRLKQ